ncbi:hypothetical protein ABMC88_01790 [Sulfitobacter sp. HNIBRBA2951]|uniref:hypothetical protein n=1 Tax=Sulfitobacter aquimarinus TaxID=3158557 RepID=UPI0032DFCF8D
MTEKLEFTEKRDIHGIGFGVALFGAPVIVYLLLVAVVFVNNALSGTQAATNGIGAVNGLSVIGVVLYFVIGTPTLLRDLKRNAPTVGGIVVLAICSLLWLLPLGALVSLATWNAGGLLGAAIAIGFGVIGAPPLAAVFALIYLRFDKA